VTEKARHAPLISTPAALSLSARAAVGVSAMVRTRLKRSFPRPKIRMRAGDLLPVTLSAKPLMTGRPRGGPSRQAAHPLRSRSAGCTGDGTIVSAQAGMAGYGLLRELATPAVAPPR